MTNEVPVRIPVDLDRPRYFTLDLAAVIRWEANTGKAFFSPKVWKHMSRKDAVLMLWACLTTGDPTLRPEDLLQLLETNKINWETVLASVEKLDFAWGNLVITYRR